MIVLVCDPTQWPNWNSLSVSFPRDDNCQCCNSGGLVYDVYMQHALCYFMLGRYRLIRRSFVRSILPHGEA